ncbi:hypothetical protein [Riemerella anatipestifer]|uniref:hypothetical protein n=1 Tax=Riemerella anatipestifer TaxID=34085 RepID=UPI00236443C8|nr:hypothetical protein [Riemerella anatipestifer]MDD1523955.1 hypothetical protein [Riemerella anatipestifer]
MKKSFYLLSTVALAALFMVSCNKRDEEISPLSQEVILPYKVETTYFEDNNEEKENIYLTYDGTKLSKEVVVFPNKSKDSLVYTYQGDLITKIKGEKTETSYEYDSNGNLTKETFISNYPSQTSTEAYTYKLNGNTVEVTLEEINKKDGNIIYKKEGFYTYTITPNKQILKRVGKEVSSSYGSATLILSNETSIEEEYTYDDRNSLFKNIRGFDKLGYSQDAIYLSKGGTNNMLTKSGKQNQMTTLYGYKYSYNDKNFPTEIENTRDGKKRSISKIEYKVVSK